MARVPPWKDDPSSILESRGMQPDPWQKEVLLARENRILLNCSRQVGKTTVVGALALHQALVCPHRPVVVIAPSLRQSLELFQHVLQGWEALDQPIGIQSRGQGRLHLENGARVLALPSKEATIRGIGGVSLLIIDEASRVEDALYKAVRPMIAASRGRLVALSTPFGKRGWFHAEWSSPRPWKRLAIPWKLCPRIEPAFIDQERDSFGDSWVAQEYECAFVSGAGLVYPDFSQTFQPDALDQQRPGGRRVGGIDFGWRNPFAAVWGQLAGDGVLWITGERVLSQTPLSEHARNLPRGVIWWADPAGRTEIEELRAAGHSVHPGNNALDAGIAAVTARIRTGKLKVFGNACPVLVREADHYRWPETTHGPRLVPLDSDNHALAALRYLIMGIDRGMGRTQRPNTQASGASGKPRGPGPFSEVWTTTEW